MKCACVLQLPGHDSPLPVCRCRVLAGVEHSTGYGMLCARLPRNHLIKRLLCIHLKRASFLLQLAADLDWEIPPGAASQTTNQFERLNRSRAYKMVKSTLIADCTIPPLRQAPLACVAVKKVWACLFLPHAPPHCWNMWLGAHLQAEDLKASCVAGEPACAFAAFKGNSSANF